MKCTKEHRRRRKDWSEGIPNFNTWVLQASTVASRDDLFTVEVQISEDSRYGRCKDTEHTESRTSELVMLGLLRASRLAWFQAICPALNCADMPFTYGTILVLRPTRLQPTDLKGTRREKRAPEA